jgi:HK97 gp10 family phage protein
MAGGGLKRLSGALEREVSQALFAAGELIEAEAGHSITQGSVSGKEHVTSAPGEPPNADTGVLDRNIETVQVGPFKVEVSSNAPYSVALEFGTSKMAARPFMGPAAQATRKQVQQTIAGAVARATKAAGA